MYGNASRHVARDTLVELKRRGLAPIFWPSNSLDLNPIKTIQDQIKDYIQEKYPEIHRSYLQLKEAVYKAQNIVTDKQV